MKWTFSQIFGIFFYLEKKVSKLQQSILWTSLILYLSLCQHIYRENELKKNSWLKNSHPSYTFHWINAINEDNKQVDWKEPFKMNIPSCIHCNSYRPKSLNACKFWHVPCAINVVSIFGWHDDFLFCFLQSLLQTISIDFFPSIFECTMNFISHSFLWI